MFITEIRSLYNRYNLECELMDTLTKALKKSTEDKDMYARQISELMESEGVESIELDEVLLKPSTTFFGSIARENSLAAAKWLKEQSYDIGNPEVLVEVLDVEDIPRVVEGVSLLVGIGSINAKVGFHWKALSSAIGNLIQSGINLPEDIISVSVKKAVKVTRK